MRTTVSSPTPSEPHRHSIRLRQSLWIGSAAIVAIVVAAFGLRFGLPMYRQHLANRDQQAAIREIEAHGAKVLIRGPDGGLTERTTADGTASPVQITADGSDITDDDLRLIGQFKNLELLSLCRVNVTDNGLAYLAGLPRLAYLDLSETPVTDAGLEPLSKIPTLGCLSLERTQVTNMGLKKLAGLRDLGLLVVYGTKVTRDGVEDLEERLPGIAIEWERPVGKAFFWIDPGGDWQGRQYRKSIHEARRNSRRPD